MHSFHLDFTAQYNDLESLSHVQANLNVKHLHNNSK